MKKIILLFLGILIIYSCSDTEDGKWDDNIKLSQKEVQFSIENNTVMITTKGKWWWIREITMNGTNYDINGVDTTLKDFLIENEEFKVKRKHANDIHIEMGKNQSGTKRILTIYLQAGNYFDRIKITQSG